MKNLLLLASFMLLGIASLFAQVEFKALAGMNFSTFHNTDTDVSAKAEYQFGAGVLIGNKFYVEPGIQFVRSSQVITPEITNPAAGSSEIDFNQNLVKIPVYAGYHILGAEDKPFALRVFAGPAVSIPGKITKVKTRLVKTILKVQFGLLMVELVLISFFCLWRPTMNIH